MSKLLLVFSISILSSAVFAENSQILKCRVANSEWNSLFILDAIGAGFLKFKKTGSSNSYTCGLKLDYINDGQRAVSPNITVEFMRGACDPELGPLEQEVFDSFTLNVDLSRKDKPEGRVQWLKRKQPDPCIVDKISMFDISMNAKKWIEGTWGRKTASEPKDLNPRKKSK